jgi:Na+:H+ antiporter, NhaA family
MGPPARPTPALLARRSRPEVRRIGDILRAETVGGVQLVAAAALGLVWANSPWGAARRWLADLRVGPATLSRRNRTRRGRWSQPYCSPWSC